MSFALCSLWMQECNKIISKLLPESKHRLRIASLSIEVENPKTNKTYLQCIPVPTQEDKDVIYHAFNVIAEAPKFHVIKFYKTKRQLSPPCESNKITKKKLQGKWEKSNLHVEPPLTSFGYQYYSTVQYDTGIYLHSMKNKVMYESTIKGLQMHRKGILRQKHNVV